MEITTLEDEAKARAAKHVANMLHAPDKLEKSTSPSPSSSSLLSFPAGLQIKEEAPDQTDSSGSTPTKRFWPSRDPVQLATKGVRASTVLTNLQRGNIPTMQTTVIEPVTVAGPHQRAGQGELTTAELTDEVVEVRDPRGKTPLMWAAAYGQTPTVNKLLQAGADVGALADESETALHLAASNGHHDVVRLLLNQGAPSDCEDENGCTPIMFAAMRNHPHCVNELLLHGADVTRTNINGESAVALAVNCRSTQAQAVLEQHVMVLMKEAIAGRLGGRSGGRGSKNN